MPRTQREDQRKQHTRRHETVTGKGNRAKGILQKEGSPTLRTNGVGTANPKTSLESHNHLLILPGAQQFNSLLGYVPEDHA
jgi:hypothetical protein